MSESTPRQIGGLAPRGADAPLSRLIRSQRDSSPPVSEPESPEPAETPAANAATKPPGRERRPRSVAGEANAPKAAMTVYVDGGVRARSRAAFKATQRLEDDSSYSDMVSKAIAAEVLRREQEYNDGQPFPGGNEPLPTGRPMAD